MAKKCSSKRIVDALVYLQYIEIFHNEKVCSIGITFHMTIIPPNHPTTVLHFHLNPPCFHICPLELKTMTQTEEI